MRNRPLPEDIFLNEIKSLITNLFIENPNYKNGYYGFYSNELINDNKKTAKYILERIQNMEHLVKDIDNK